MADTERTGRTGGTWQTVRAHPGFALALVLTLALAAFNGLMVALMALRIDDVLPQSLAQMGHFTEAHHRIHDVAFGTLFLPAVVGLLAQFRRPARNVAGMLMALVPSGALLLALLLTLVLGGDARTLQPPWVMVGAGALIATGLHPAGRDFFRSFRRSRADPAMLGLTLVAAVPLVVFATTNLRLQSTVADDHAAAGHYGFMAALAFAVIALGLLASLRPDGWRVTAWVAALLPALLSVTSILYPEATSSLSLRWSGASLVLSGTFLATALRPGNLRDGDVADAI